MAAHVSVTLLRELSRQYEARSPAKLLALARRQHVPATPADVKAALAPEIGKQLFAPKQRSLGKSAAEGPGERLQADLVDLSNNAHAKPGDHKYALMVADVYTRKTWTEPLRYKDSTSVNREFRKILRDVPGKGQNAVVTTDQGNEFKQLDAHVLSKDAVHREKEVNDPNATAVVDRAMQTIKRDLASRVARTGKGWASELDSITEAYNERPHSAVHGAPNTAAEGGPQQFMIEQDNAAKFMHNRNLTIRRQDALKEAGAFRTPIHGESRSFRPAYSEAVHVLGKMASGGGYVTNTARGKKTLLKQALAVPKESGKPLGHLTTPRRQPGPRIDLSPKPSFPVDVAPAVAPVVAVVAAPPAKKKGADFFKSLRASYGIGVGPK